MLSLTPILLSGSVQTLQGLAQNCWHAPLPGSVAVAHKRQVHRASIPSLSRRQWRTRQAATRQTQPEQDDDQLTAQSAAKSDHMLPESGKDDSNMLAAQLCLCGVAVLWGTYSPVVRFIYASDGPPSPATLTAVRTVIQAAVLLASNAFVSRQQLSSAAAPTRRARSLRNSSSPNIKRTSSSSSQPQPIRSLIRKVRSALNSTTDELWVAGIELGLWNFCGSTFQAIGLQYTTATRGAFLIQVTNFLQAPCSMSACEVTHDCCFATSATTIRGHHS